MLPERPRIFFASEDIGLCMSSLAEGFRALGCKTTTMVTHKEVNAPEIEYDIVRGDLLRRRFEYGKKSRVVAGISRRVDAALNAAVNGAATPSYLDHDVFVFFWKPWTPAPVLFPLLKRLGKKIVVYYLGSEARHVSAFCQEYGVDASKWGRSYHLDPLEPKLEAIRWAELYADLIYSVPDQAGLQIRPYYHTFVPLKIDLEPHVPDREVPVVLHAPSWDVVQRGDIKGTSYVRAAMEQLQAEGVRFDFKYIHGMMRKDVLEILKSSDVVVDELILHGPGALAAEAMRAGCAVATHIIEPPHPFFDAPVCPVDPTNVKERTRRLITDRAYRVELAAKGPAWAKQVFDPTWIAARMLRHLRGEVMPEYVPRFYLERYEPPVRLSPYLRALSLRVAERFRPETAHLLFEAAKRGVVAKPGRRRLREARLESPHSK
jgi:hypothetical protein